MTTLDDTFGGTTRIRTWIKRLTVSRNDLYTMDPNIIFKRTFKISILFGKDGMRNPLDHPPGEGSTMFKSAIRRRQP